MPRTPSPEVRSQLIERAAAMLTAREPVTLRALVAGTGLSTMAVYTYFDGMPGLWRAVRAEGFRRLAERTARVDPHSDPVRHLALLGVAYVETAVANPDLFRVMFDATVELDDPSVADATFGQLVAAAGRAITAGRLASTNEATDVALQFWSSGHGIVVLGISGVLPISSIPKLASDLATAVFIHAGDDPLRARRSVAAAWRTTTINAAPI